MSNLDFLEVNQNFKSYYQTLRDANYYFRNRPEIQGLNQIIGELLLNFIGLNDTTFRDMNPEEYERVYRIFEDDFLDVIKNSALNNDDFQIFAGLIDEIIGIARMRANALQKINRRDREDLLEDVEIIISQNADDDDEDLSNGPSEIYVTISDENNECEDSNSEESFEELDEYILDEQNNEEDIEVEAELNEIEINGDAVESNEIISDEDAAESNEIFFDEAAAEFDEMLDSENMEEESTGNHAVPRPYIKYKYENS